MAVYRRGYQRYEGALTNHFGRMMVIPRYSWERILSQRFVTILLVVSLFWPVLCAGFVYLANHTELWQGLGGGLKRFLAINGRFFAVFMNVQSTFALIMAAVAGPGLIAPDLVNNALPLYFSRPMTRQDYILSRLIVLLGILSLVTIVPGMLLFGMQVGIAGFDWFIQNWYLGAAIFFGFLLYIGVVSLVALTSSAYVKWRVVAGALVLAFFFLLTGAAEMVNHVFRVDWASALNPAYALNTVWAGMLDIDIPDDKPGVMECATFLLAISGGLLAALARKLRPVEVVR
ncbi:MAG: ABC transporter permease [Acidobacteria bacterium]|nr:ABC transporter permease [Acidobacteriota bacterium]